MDQICAYAAANDADLIVTSTHGLTGVLVVFQTSTKVLSKKQYKSMLRLLRIFGQHLSILSNQLTTQAQQHAEPQAVTRAREFIEKNQDRDVSLGEVAKAVNTSTFYFCKVFKKATGLTFTNYLSRVRSRRRRTSS